MEKSCGVILFNEDKVLLLQHPDTNNKKGHWDFPKGHVENGESETQTALRELAEETGIINLKLFSDFRHKISYNLTKEGREISKEVIFFVGVTNETEIVLSDEHQSYAWLNYESANKRLTYDNAKKSLEFSIKFYLEE